MNRHISNRMLLFIPFLLLIIVASFIHNSIIGNVLNEKLKQLHASGVFVEMQKEEENLFKSKKEFIIRVDKVELIAELLLGIRANDPLIVQFSKLQGLKLNVKLSHNKFIFSNELNMYLSINTLPEYFANQSQLFSDIVLFSNDNPHLIQTKLNIWNNTFRFDIPNLSHTFIAEQNLSFEVNVEDFSLYGYIKKHSDFDINNNFEKLDIALLLEGLKKSELNITQGSLNINHSHDSMETSISFEDLKLDFTDLEPLSLSMTGLATTQTFTEEEKSHFRSFLNLESLHLSNSQDLFSLKNINYDIALKHLDYTTIEHIRELINTSNTNTVVFIYEDLSKDIETLIKHQAEIALYNFSFDDISIKNKHYQEGKLTLQAKSQPENTEQPIDFDMNLHLSKPLYKEFLEKIPNASLTKKFITDQNSSADFHLKLTKKGLVLNNKNLYHAVKPENNASKNSLKANETIPQDPNNETHH